MNDRQPHTFQAVLLLEPTGAGKTPLGDWLAKNGFGNMPPERLRRDAGGGDRFGHATECGFDCIEELRQGWRGHQLNPWQMACRVAPQADIFMDVFSRH
jgi:hypothetical protein